MPKHKNQDSSGTDYKPPVTASLWRNHDFRLLFGAQIISLGSGVTTAGLALFAYQLTGGRSATAVIGNALTLRLSLVVSAGRGDCRSHQ